MNIVHAFILGIIQGITEFLPISSSAHLVLVPGLFNWPQQSLTFDIVVHAGSLMAILYYYREKIASIAKPLFTSKLPDQASKKLIVNIIITSVPTALSFLLFKDYLDNTFSSLKVIPYTLFFGGILLICADSYSKKIKEHKSLNKKIAFLIGIGQGISLIRGISRSGASLTVGLFGGVKRKQLIEYVFLASIPVITAGLLLEMVLYLREPTPENGSAITVGLLSSAASSYFAIKLLNAFLARNIIFLSGVYRIVLALILIFLV